MKFCEDGHEEVCYECIWCPACEVLHDLGRKDELLQEALTEIESLEEAVELLQAEAEARQ